MLGSKLMREAEVISLGYFSKESSRIIWDSFIKSSVNPKLFGMTSEDQTVLFESVHSICRGHIPDMRRMIVALQTATAPNFENALAQAIAAPGVIFKETSDLYNKSPGQLSSEERSKLRVLRALFNAKDAFLSMNSLPVENLPAMESLLKENVLSVFYAPAVPYDSSFNHTDPQSYSGPFPIITFSSVFIRLRLIEESKKRLEIEKNRLEMEWKKLEMDHEIEKNRLEMDYAVDLNVKGKDSK